MRPPKIKDLEEKLFEWFQRKEKEKRIINNDILAKQAKILNDNLYKK